MFFKNKVQNVGIIKMSIREREAPLTKEVIIASIIRNEPVCQTVKSDPRKKYRLDRLNEKAEKILQQLGYYR